VTLRRDIHPPKDAIASGIALVDRCKEDSTTWTVTGDWPEDVPVTEAEMFEARFGDLFDEPFSTRN
jgi:hypothetical protein